MAQHDLVIANASGATVRADINDALAALGSTMKGPNAPPSPLAGMMWLEDDTPSGTRWTLRVYDGATWIAMGVIDATTDIFEPASTAVGLALIRAADAAAGRAAINAAPMPTTSAGAGQIILLNPGAGADAVLPAGGTWAWFFLTFSSPAGANLFVQGVGVNAGGSTIVSGQAGVAFLGFAWRVL